MDSGILLADTSAHQVARLSPSDRVRARPGLLPARAAAEARDIDDNDDDSAAARLRTAGAAADLTTYPEGGRDAWLVVLGAWCGLTASLGLYNTSGVFEAVVVQTVLPGTSAATLGWLFSLYAAVNWLCGILVGPAFDVLGPRRLMAAGTACTLVGMFAFSVCTEYYQILLSFSLLTGIGSSLLITPSLGCVAHWFSERRGLASGIAFVGGGFGGVLFPLLLQALLPHVGWPWAVRILAFVLLVLCAGGVALCRSRLPPRRGAAASAASTPAWRDMLPTMRIFVDGSGAMAATTAGILLTDMAYLIPVTYVPSYYLDRQGLSSSSSSSEAAGVAGVAGAGAFAFQLLALLNAASCFGRCAAGTLADRLGRYNTMIASLALCVAAVLGLWLPDILHSSAGGNSAALVIVFVLLFGFVSGSNFSLTPICLGQLCDTRDYGRYYATCYTVVALGVLASLPVAGRLLAATGTTAGARRYWTVALFTGLSYVAALLCFLWVRFRVRGGSWKAKW